MEGKYVDQNAPGIDIKVKRPTKEDDLKKME
jgi:hypothetical protein